MAHRRLLAFALLLSAALTAGCGGGRATSPAPVAKDSAGQVGAAKAYKVSYYAAARFAEQATFGPTPALIEELRTKGFAQWIDEQLAIPQAVIDVAPVNITDRNRTPPEMAYPRVTFGNLALTAPDQLIKINRRSGSISGAFITAYGRP